MGATHDPLAAGVRAFRDVTAEPADGRASRARVLDRAAARSRHRDVRALAVSAAALALLLPAAGVALVRLSRTSAQTSPVVSRESPRLGAARPRAAADVSPPAPAPAPPPPASLPPAPPAPVFSAIGLRAVGATPELAAYARAHRAHFHEQSPRQALHRWDAYLTKFPRGRFRPEAELNRAICLVHLGDLDRARAGLEALQREGIPEHVRAQAERLLRRLGPP